MTKFLSFFGLCMITIILISCATSQKNNPNSNKDQTSSISSPKNSEDGLTFETAVMINEKTESKGVNAEYDWIKKHYSNYTINGQKLTTYNKTPYDIITLSFSNNKEIKLYFNISKFFGNF